MEITISAPHENLSEADLSGIENDVQKIDRRLGEQDAFLEIRVSGDHGAPTRLVTMELEYGRNHLIAKEDGQDIRQAVRVARDEIVRQIGKNSPGGSHSDHAKR